MSLVLKSISSPLDASEAPALEEEYPTLDTALTLPIPHTGRSLLSSETWAAGLTFVEIKSNQMGVPDGSDGTESTCNAGDLGSIPGLGRTPWRREWLPTPVFWPGDFHGLCSPRGCKEQLSVKLKRERGGYQVSPCCSKGGSSQHLPLVETQG